MRSPFSCTVTSAPSWRARAAATRPAIPAPAIGGQLHERERRLVLDVLDLHALRAPHEHGVRVRCVDDVGDLGGQLFRVVARSTSTARWFRSGRSGSVGSPAWNSRYAPPSSTRGTPSRGSASLKPSERYRARLPRGRSSTARRGRGRSRPRPSPDDVHRQPLADVVRGLRSVVDAQRHVLERALLTRPLLVEERELEATRIRAEQREAIGALDRVHAEIRDQPLGDRVAVGYPQRDVVNGPGRHRESA